MPIQLHSNRFRSTTMVLAAAIGVALAGCAAGQGGAPVAASSSSPAEALTSTAPTGATTLASSSAVAVPNRTSPTATSASPPVPSPPVPSTASANGKWSAIIETGTSKGIPSPTGELNAVLAGDGVCFVPTTGAKKCGQLAAGVMATFAVFSPDGSSMLVVAGPQNAAGAYVFDTADGTARVLGPQGVQEYPAGSAPPVWDLSSAVWGVDGSTVLLVPRTAEPTGSVLSFDLASGASSELIRLDAALANSSPSLWTTNTGLAVIANAGEQQNVLWFADFATGAARKIGDFPEPGGSLVLGSADPLGRTAVVCPKRADGRLGATIGIAVDGSASGKLLADSLSCAGSVFSADGSYLALTAGTDAGYVLIVADLLASSRVLTVPLPVSEPSAPPYLTWLGDVIVATDVTGEWPVPSLTVRLQR